MCLVLSDSMLKYMKASNTTVLAYGGETAARLCDRIRFGEVKVNGFTKILVHVGTNDLSTLVESGNVQHVGIHELLRSFKVLRDVIRKRNSEAIILFSSILPRVRGFDLYRHFVYGLNFALEKWCAKSNGSSIFIPSFSCFLFEGRPRSEYFARDGLHLNGAGIDKMEAVVQQAFASKYLFQRVNARRTMKLLSLRY